MADIIPSNANAEASSSSTPARASLSRISRSRVAGNDEARKRPVDPDSDVEVIPPSAKRNRVSSVLSVGSSDAGEEEQRAVLRVKVENGGEDDEEKKRSELFADPKADFEIISEDDVSLRIHSYHLLAHSPYFRNLQDQGVMTSPHHLAYRAETIEDLLSLMTRRDFCSTYTKQYYNRFKRLTRLSKHLECQFLLERITMSLREALGKAPHKPYYIFWAALAIEDFETCRRALPTAATELWPPEADTNGAAELSCGVPGCSKLDVATMPEHVIKRLSDRHIAALSRAYRLRGRNADGSKGDWVRVANEFHRLMTL